MYAKKTVKKRISSLLNKSIDHSLIIPEISPSQSYFLLNKSLFNNMSYKAYVRYPEIPLSDNHNIKHTNFIFLSQLLSELGKFIKESRSKRLFEIYLYQSSPAVPIGLYHYYIKNHSLEHLVIPETAKTDTFIKNLIKEKFIAYIAISLRIHFLPQTDRLYWYWLNIFELGRLVQTVINKAQSSKKKAISLEFTNKYWNAVLSLSQSRESVIQVLRIS